MGYLNQDRTQKLGPPWSHLQYSTSKTYKSNIFCSSDTLLKIFFQWTTYFLSLKWSFLEQNPKRKGWGQVVNDHLAIIVA